MVMTPVQAQLFNFTDKSETVVVQQDGLDLIYYPNFIEEQLADQWFEELEAGIDWRQDQVTVYGKTHLTPRLTCWMGESGVNYSYSNHTMRAVPWSARPLAIKERIERHTREKFNSVLINYYRDGQDSNGWHADDEPELGAEPVIASLSLGAGRDFDLRRKNDHQQKLRFHLTHGSLLVMRGRTQQCWQHHVPKRAKAASRINLTYRTIVAHSKK